MSSSLVCEFAESYHIAQIQSLCLEAGWGAFNSELAELVLSRCPVSIGISLCDSDCMVAAWSILPLDENGCYFSLIVREQYRRREVGRQVFREVARECFKDDTNVYLYTPEKHVNFFRHLGFQVSRVGYCCRYSGKPRWQHTPQMVGIAFKLFFESDVLEFSGITESLKMILKSDRLVGAQAALVNHDLVGIFVLIKDNENSYHVCLRATEFKYADALFHRAVVQYIAPHDLSVNIWCLSCNHENGVKLFEELYSLKVLEETVVVEEQGKKKEEKRRKRFYAMYKGEDIPKHPNCVYGMLHPQIAFL